MNFHVPPENKSTRTVEELVKEHFRRADAWADVSRQPSRLGEFLNQLQAETWRRRRHRFTRPIPKVRFGGLAGWFSRYNQPNTRARESSKSWAVAPQRERKKIGKGALLGMVIISLVLGKVAFAKTADEAIGEVVIALSNMINSDAEVIEKQIMANQRCAKRQLVVDADGNWAGLAAPLNEDCSKANYRYVYSPVSQNMTSKLIDALEALEGQSRIGARTVLGMLDIPAVGKRFVETITLGKRLSGSTPLLSSIEAVTGNTEKLGFQAKMTSIWSAAVYSSKHLQTNQSRELFMAEGMACLRGLNGSRFGYPIAGSLCSTALFPDTKPDALRPGQICLWASSMGFSIAIAREGSNPEGFRTMAKTLKRAKTRATTCIQRLGLSSSQASDEIKYINQYKLPAALLNRSISAFSAGFGYGLGDELRLSNFKVDEKPVRLSISLEKQRDAYDRIQKHLKRLNRRLAKGLCFGRADCVNPDYSLVVAEIKNNELIGRLAISNRYNLLRGPVIENTNGIFNTVPSEISHGSISKLIPILVTAMAGKKALCNKSFAGIQNVDGSKGYKSCKNPAAKISTKTSVARSDNLPFIHEMLLRNAALRQVLSALPVKWDQSASRQQLAIGTVLGYGATASILTEMQLLAAISNGRDGKSAQSAAITFASSTKNGAVIDLARAGINNKAVRLAASWLNAPLSSKDGTLKRFGAMLKKNGCEPMIGKSGSAETSTSKTGISLKAAVLTFQCGTRQFAAGITLGAPNGADQNIGNIYTRDLVPLLENAIEAMKD